MQGAGILSSDEIDIVVNAMRSGSYAQMLQNLGPDLGLSGDSIRSCIG